MNLQTLKKAMLAYVSAVKFIWSGIAYPLSIVGKKFMNLRGYRVYGNSVQDGTPSPDNPVEIESVGDLTSKNLFSFAKDNTTTAFGLTFSCTKGESEFTVDGDMTQSIGYRFAETAKLTMGIGAYTFSTNIVQGYKESGLFVYNLTTGNRLGFFNFNNKLTLRFTEETDISIGFSIAKSNYNNKAICIQLEEGTTATEYEPYHKYKIPVVARGKNMATAQQVYFNAKNYSECIEDGRNCIRCTSDGTSYAGVNFKEKTQYTVRFEAKTVTWSAHGEDTSTEVLFAFTHTDGTRKVIVAKGDTDWTYYEATSLANKTIASVGMYSYNYKHWIYINVDTFQIEEGTSATEYETYIAPVTTNIFLDEPLRKVGDYADYVDFEKQKVARNVERTDCLRASWHYYNNNRHGIAIQSALKYNSARLKGMSNRLNVFTAIGDETCTFWLGVGNNTIYWVGILDVLGIYDASKTEAEMFEEFNTWLADNPTYVIYPLATPTEETVKLPALPQFKGTTIYEVGTNIKPSGIEAKYC